MRPDGPESWASSAPFFAALKASMRRRSLPLVFSQPSFPSTALGSPLCSGAYTQSSSVWVGFGARRSCLPSRFLQEKVAEVDRALASANSDNLMYTSRSSPSPSHSIAVSIAVSVSAFRLRLRLSLPLPLPLPLPLS
eukprot:2012812-Rhodomonas_salina.1